MAPDRDEPVEPALPATPVGRLEDLLERVELDRFVTYELRGRRRDGGFDDVEPGEDPPPGGVVEHDFNASLLLDHSDDYLAVRLKAHVNAYDAEYTCDIAAVYTLSEPVSVSEPVMRSFLESVAVMSVFPYVRQAVHDCSSRVGSPVTLKLMRSSTVGPIGPDDPAGPGGAGPRDTGDTGDTADGNHQDDASRRRSAADAVADARAIGGSEGMSNGTRKA